MALRGYYRSDRHDEDLIESHLDIRDHNGDVVPGYGWIFPLGDGRVNVGVGLLSTDRRWKGLNTSRPMDAFVEQAPRSWGLSPETSCGPATGGRLPMGMAVGPRTGANTLVVGDAGGLINPFNGEGIAYGYETGRLAASFLGEALSGGGTEVDRRLRAPARRGLRHLLPGRGGRSSGSISDPRRMRLCVGVDTDSHWFMAQLLRIMANLMRPQVSGPAEAVYRELVGIADTLERLEKAGISV